MVDHVTGEKANARQRKQFGADVICVSALTQHVTLPKINQDLTPDNTFWLYDSKANVPKWLYTRLEKSSDVDIAWTNCGGCMNPVFQCKCPGGIRVPRSVEYIYDQNRAQIAGEDWGIYHPNYYGSLVRASQTRASESAARDTLVRRGVVTAAEQAAQKAAEQKVLNPNPTPVKRRPRIRGSEPEAPSLEKISEAAEKSAKRKVRVFAEETPPKRRPRIRREGK